MALPYPYVTDNQYHINTGSYLDQKETEMFVTAYADDYWYGFGETDVIEMSVFDLDQNPLGWKTINSEKEYKKITMTYLDTLDRPTEYSYLQLISDFTLYKNTKILVNPIDQLEQNFGLVSGSFLLSYNFMREMAGSPFFPLVVKEISPARKEVKLIPAGSNSLRYQAFCLKKFQVKDVAPLLIQKTNQCPYDQIYARVKGKYSKEIEYLKQLLFLTSDGAFVAFLKTFYEDVVIYTHPTSLNQSIEQVKRTQGIRSYYQNLLLSNYETISDFIALDDAYDAFTKLRVDQHFKPYGSNQGKDLSDAKKFLVEFFTTEFYHPITLTSKASFESKYYAYFKNALNLGNGTMFTIIDHTYLDERLTDTDPLTLLVKLKTELPDDIKIQTTCWVSNISIAPFVVNAIVRRIGTGTTIKISPANFTLQSDNISLYNINEQFTAADLRDTTTDQQAIDINKKISELQVDYSDFSNFVVFSSAQQRLANFKTKISSWHMLSASSATLENTSSQYLAEGRLYPQYALERGSLDSQMQGIVNSFDGYESYLFKSGSYVYDPTTGFVNASYVAEQDYTASLYDKANRDSLINNTPDHIVLDEGNNEYLMFLNMVGHFFDNIYLYITNLPSEKMVSNDPTLTFSKKMVDYMLESFGWKVGTTDEDLSALDTYTTSSSSVCASDRTKSIRTRLLTTLPQIYKTKGTEEAIKLLLSCYGIPSNLLDVREYGNNDYTTASLVTYTKRERSCLIQYSGSGFIITQTFEPKPRVRTLETKMLFKNPELYTPREYYTFASSDHTYTSKWDYNWNVHNYYWWAVPIYDTQQYYSYFSLPAWRMGYMREYGNMGRIWAEVATYSSSYYSTGLIGTFSGSFSGSVRPRATGSVSGMAFFSSSYYSGSINGGSIVEISGSISGALAGRVTGSLLTFTRLDFVGELTGANGDFSQGTFTQYGNTWGVSYAYSKIGYDRLPRVFLTSSLLPIFDGDIFNIRLRRNEPDPSYQYMTNAEFVPSVYDLTIQRNEGGRQVFRSYTSALGVYEDNMVWDGISTYDPYERTGSIGTWTTSSIYFSSDPSYYALSNTVNFAFGNTMVWDVPISDADFEIHCNDFSSFAYSGSDGEKHLITRMDADEATPFVDWSTYTYDYKYVALPDYIYYDGYASGRIPNKSEYYSTFQERFHKVVESGSWTGNKTGSLWVGETFTGSMKGTMSGSLSGNGHGYFITSSIYGGVISTNWFRGYISGSMTGSFHGLASGVISGSAYQRKGYYGGHWVGSAYAADVVTRSLFVGNFSGMATGSFDKMAIMVGQMTSSYFTFSGARLGGWTGSFTGSMTGSMKLVYASGSFWGYNSASIINIDDIGEFSGTTDRAWYGSLTGSFTGSFTGSTGEIVFTGSTPPYYYYGQVVFSGSMKGSITSSVYDVQWLLHPYSSGSYSGSFLQQWTGSPVILYGKTIMPKDITFEAYNAWYPLNPSASVYPYCDYLNIYTYDAAYPYQYMVKDIEKTYSTPSYGPNRFKNEKIKPKKQAVAARFDDLDRSTSDLITGVQSDSNLLGLYLDPQDAKNRDIVKFCGNNDVVSLIADPAIMYSGSYPDLHELNQEYNSYGDRRVLYNELIALYKIYFNRSVFDSVKNIVPARASVRTGILVEPTILERPKYQHRPIFSEANTGSVFYADVTASHYFHDPITKLMRFSGSKGNTSAGTLGLLYCEFNTAGVSSQSLDYNTLPANPSIQLDFSYINEANFNYPVNYNNGYYCDLADSLQFGNYGSLGHSGGYLEAWGVTPQEYLDDHFNNSGEENTFIVKKWDKHTIYSKSGSYVRNSNKGEDVYVSHSTWLYSLVGMSPQGYNQFFYTASVDVRSGSRDNLSIASDVTAVGGYYFYTHRANTARKTPNQPVTAIQGTMDAISYPYVVLVAPYVSIAKETYFEVFGGYPRNHYTHKRMLFSPMKFNSLTGRYKVQTAAIYVRCRQTTDTTIDDASGLEDASLPVQSIETSNVNLQQSDNVINQ